MCVLYAFRRALRHRFYAPRPPSPRDLSRWELTHTFGLTRIAVIDAVISEVQSSVENEPMQVLFLKVPDTRCPSRFSPCSPFCLLHHCVLLALFQGVPSDLALPLNFLLQPISPSLLYSSCYFQAEPAVVSMFVGAVWGILAIQLNGLKAVVI